MVWGLRDIYCVRVAVNLCNIILLFIVLPNSGPIQSLCRSLNADESFAGCQNADIRRRCDQYNVNKVLTDLDSMVKQLNCSKEMPSLQCLIYKLNCYDHNSTTQVYDPPCQSSCFAVHEMCKKIERRVLMRASNCRLLPQWGCDDWVPFIKDVRGKPINVTHIRSQTKENSACQTSKRLCSKMFPRKLTRRNFLRGNYTNVLRIRIAQTMWNVDNTSAHFYFSPRVDKGFLTNVHPNLQTIMHKWPRPCPCPGQIYNTATYLVFTHHIGHKLLFNDNTVFLPFTRKMTKKIKCWLKLKKCNRRKRNRKRRMNGR